MARSFDGATTYLANSSAVVTAAPLTIAGWVNLTAVGAINRTILTIKDDASAQERNCFTFGMTDTERFRALTGSGAGTGIAISGVMTAGQWNHGVALFESSASRYAFLNGTAGAQNTTSRVPSGQNGTTIGRQPYSSGSADTYWDGYIAELAVWDAALTQAEISSLATGIPATRIRPQSLVAYWPLVGRESPEPDVVGGYTMTVTAAVAATHPRIARRRPRTWFIPPAAVAGGVGPIIGGRLLTGLVNGGRLVA